MSVTNDEISKKLDALLLSMNKPDLDNELWTVGHIASYLSVAHTTARDKVVRAPSFPKPRKITTDNGVMRRWSRDAVKAWAERH